MDSETKQMFELIIGKLDKMDARLDTVEKTQKAMVVKIDELYAIARATEENIKVTRAEQEKIAFQMANIQGKVNSLTGEVKEHEHIIQQIRAIK
ncbi:hypothetical protein SAMN02745248_02048 [Hathewaya proteolytica DSM 3090]|uniref:Uncharacterized protein n=1 Tax=Hathewaya proteolytica DSM 3090 TaxID=1121331 RepID=A0A1M6QLP3_9CLOT|nr:hypothetical protein [Hathewaya proteolytica]SHK21098.1 hypothetical protein SAMN02745248_02048 [Hathewaya proteolytica DSM 3090]